MRLAGIEKGGFYPYPPQWPKPRLPGSSRFQRAHVGDCSTPPRVKVKSPANWASCSTQDLRLRAVPLPLRSVRALLDRRNIPFYNAGTLPQ